MRTNFRNLMMDYIMPHSSLSLKTRLSDTRNELIAKHKHFDEADHMDDLMWAYMAPSRQYAISTNVNIIISDIYSILNKELKNL